jgi:hypothetical protein
MSSARLDAGHVGTQWTGKVASASPRLVSQVELDAGLIDQATADIKLDTYRNVTRVMNADDAPPADEQRKQASAIEAEFGKPNLRLVKAA